MARAAAALRAQASGQVAVVAVMLQTVLPVALKTRHIIMVAAEEEAVGAVRHPSTLKQAAKMEDLAEVVLLATVYMVRKAARADRTNCKTERLAKRAYA